MTDKTKTGNAADAGDETDRIPASDITAPGGVYRDKDGYHDANGNRLTDAEGEERLAKRDELTTSRTQPITEPGRREPNPPAPSTDLAGGAGDPAGLTDPKGEKENAPPSEESPARGASGSPKPGTAPLGRPRTPGAVKTVAELEAMQKDELVAEAAKRQITVTRGDGEDGEPLKDDYVKALSK